MELDKANCPACGAPAVGDCQGNQFHCRNCGLVLDLERTLCPGCGLLNLAGRSFCSRCDAVLVRVCPGCQRENWAGYDACQYCGRSLDLLEIMTQARVRDTTYRLQAQQREAQAIKQREASQSEARLAEYWQQEAQRQRVLAARAEQESKRERQLILFAVLGVVLFIALLALLAMIAA